MKITAHRLFKLVFVVSGGLNFLHLAEVEKLIEESVRKNSSPQVASSTCLCYNHTNLQKSAKRM